MAGQQSEEAISYVLTILTVSSQVNIINLKMFWKSYKWESTIRDGHWPFQIVNFHSNLKLVLFFGFGFILCRKIVKLRSIKAF